MIQRIQSVFLALVFVVGMILFISPVLSFTSYENTFVMNAYHTLNSIDHTFVSKNIGIGAMQGLISLLALISIFLFKKRQLQIKLCKLNMLLVAFQIAAMVLYIDIAQKAISPEHSNDVVIGIKYGAIIPILSWIFLYLSIRYIKKDDDLVRSADRLR